MLLAQTAKLVIFCLSFSSDFFWQMYC